MASFYARWYDMSDAEVAGILRDFGAMRTRPMPTNDTDGLLWTAARGLQLHYDTPHQMICLDSCLRLERAVRAGRGAARRAPT